MTESNYDGVSGGAMLDGIVANDRCIFDRIAFMEDLQTYLTVTHGLPRSEQIASILITIRKDLTDEDKLVYANTVGIACRLCLRTGYYSEDIECIELIQKSAHKYMMQHDETIEDSDC